MIALIGLLVLLAAGLVAAYAISALVRPQADLDRAINPYLGGPAAAATGSDADGPRTLIDTALLRRAVDATANLAERRGLFDGLERKLDQADLQLRPAELVFLVLSGAVVVSVFGLLVDPLVGVAAAVISLLGPPAALNASIERRRKKFLSVLPDTLELLASALRSGYSLQQAIDTVAHEVQEPMGRELRRVMVESQLGRPLDEALGEVAGRMGSPDFEWAVLAIRIQREVGGNLAELLSTVAETIVERDRLRREVKTLTAEGRMGAGVVAAIPIVLGAYMYVRNPGYLTPLFTTSTGKFALVASAVGLVLGFAWMRKITDIAL